jgi:hypothetical protein
VPTRSAMGSAWCHSSCSPTAFHDSATASARDGFCRRRSPPHGRWGLPSPPDPRCDPLRASELTSSELELAREARSWRRPRKGRRGVAAPMPRGEPRGKSGRRLHCSHEGCRYRARAQEGPSREAHHRRDGDGHRGTRRSDRGHGRAKRSEPSHSLERWHERAHCSAVLLSLGRDSSERAAMKRPCPRSEHDRRPVRVSSRSARRTDSAGRRP